MSLSNISRSLPWDIIEEIFTRLPVKSLQRFQCVSQSWNSLITNLITNPLFVSKHLIMNRSKGAQILVNRICSPTLRGYASSYALLGFCNGLLCVRASKTTKIIIWNPATTEYIILPENVPDGYRDICEEKYYGFGYDAKSDDYTVCCYHIICKMDRRGRCYRPREAFFNIYSVRENSWRRIEEFPYKIIYRVYGTFIHGSIYWLATHRQSNDGNYFIIAFDLVDKQFRELPLPRYEENIYLNYIVLDTLDGCLCSLRRLSNSKHVELWTMKDDGLQTWTKLYTIRMEGPLRESKLLHYSDASSANLLLKDGYNIVSYNPKQSCVRKLKSLNITEHDMGAVAYFESLVSPVMHGCLVNNPQEEENNDKQVLSFSFTTNDCQGSYQCNLVTYEKTAPETTTPAYEEEEEDVITIF